VCCRCPMSPVRCQRTRRVCSYLVNCLFIRASGTCGTAAHQPLATSTSTHL
jgi:hypothetical protein